ncbi:MAG: DUF2834 domain-containing protein [Deltaproteobacteria bacterium]|nr:DUF2834 domain-containing protein [Deltaproteobacteria bacterium]
MSALLASGWSLVAWLGLVAALVALARAHASSRVPPPADPHAKARPPSDALAWCWRASALLGFALTWTFMIRMALEDIARYPSLGAWSRESNLFFDAYRRVTETPAAWWWSQHLMAWALAGTLWFTTAGRARGARAWPYLWLAMCVAVSVALPLFAQRLRAAAPVARVRDDVHALVAVGIFGAAVALVATPVVGGAPFIVAMLVLHGGLLVPALVSQDDASRDGRRVALRPIAIGVAVVCFLLHVFATLRLHDTPLRALGLVVVRDPAQSSISGDVVLTWLASTMLVATSRGRRRAVAFFVLAPVVSLGAAFVWAVLLTPRPPREGEVA